VLKNGSLTVVVPVHGNRTIAPGLLAAILEGAELSPEQLDDLL
jgi:predicted RNA binding protein YcfA (HicA-like mRNA interferase family)